jgi:hypothetical protein
MERRKQSRIKTNNLSIVVSDGIGPSQGLVSDMSLSGMRINNLPKRLHLKTGHLSVIISQNTKLFRMNAKPRWYLEKDGKISIGVNIKNFPLRWREFIQKYENQPGCSSSTISLGNDRLR